MRKWKWPFLLVLFTGAIIAVAYEQHHAREKYQAQREADCIDLSLSPAEDDACAKEAQNRKDYAPWWNVLVAWPEGITTWAIILTFAAVGWQADETRKAAMATKDAAKAALLNAQVLINSERPWVLVKAEPSKGALGFNGFDITAMNRGRTPGSIISVRSGWLIVDQGEKLPESPVYGEERVVSEILLPDEPLHIDSVGSGTVAMYCVSEEKWKRVLGMDAWAYFVGRIVYRDLLGPADAPPHETQWAFSYVPGQGDEFYLTAFTPPLGWTKHT
jgi:hypothetical protein